MNPVFVDGETEGYEKTTDVPSSHAKDLNPRGGDTVRDTRTRTVSIPGQQSILGSS